MECYLRKTCKKFVNNTVDGVNCDFDTCIKYQKTKLLLDMTLLSDKQRMMVMVPLKPDKCDYIAFCELDDWRSNVLENVSSGASIYLHSNKCGNGKTSWAIKILLAFINKVWYNSPVTCRGLFISVPKYLSSVKDNLNTKNEYAEYVNKYIRTADLVIWDDIATKTLSPFEAELLLSIIDDRINLGKSNIYTCNLDPTEMEQALGGRLYSRIVNLSLNIDFNGNDKRGKREEEQGE